MSLIKPAVIGAALLSAMTIAALAQPPPYPPYPYAQPYPLSPATAAPPAWSYDPYTSGAAPCPQGIRGDLQTCAEKMPPTYGQPTYWPTPR